MRLLLTYDGSDASRKAFPAAAVLARATAGEIIILRVYHPTREMVTHPEPERREEAIRKAEAEWKAELERTAASIGENVRPVIRRLGERWNVVDEILAVAKESGVDIICMATQGDSALRHFFIGSTAMEVLARSPVPVLLVNAGQREN